MLSTLKHHAKKALLRLYGPAQLDEQHDPVRAEERAIADDDPSDRAREPDIATEATVADINSGAAARRARQGTGGTRTREPFGS